MDALRSGANQIDGHMPGKDRASTPGRHPLDADRHEGPGDRPQGLLPPQRHAPGRMRGSRPGGRLHPLLRGGARAGAVRFFWKATGNTRMCLWRSSSATRQLRCLCAGCRLCWRGFYRDASGQPRSLLDAMSTTRSSLWWARATALGAALTWIGFELRWVQGTLCVRIPDKLRDELLQALRSWSTKGLVPVSELRSIAGKATWAAGIYPRARFAVSMLYKALSDRQQDVKSGAEKARREARRDDRPKDYLPPSVMIITDASPQGLGGLLLVRATTKEPWTPVQAFEYAIGANNADLLGFTLWRIVPRASWKPWQSGWQSGPGRTL